MPDDERILWPNNDKFFGLLQKTLKKLHKPIDV